MPVGIFQDTDPDSRVSTDLSLLNPIIFKFSQAGGTEERQLFLRHDFLSGAEAESSLDVTVDPVDLATVEGDQSTWLQVAADSAGVAGTYAAAGAAKNLGNVNMGQTLPFWVKATVPANSEVGARDDISLKVTSTNSFITKTIDISAGTYSGVAEYDAANNAIKLSWSNTSDTGEFLSPWTDMSVASAITDISYTEANENGGSVFASYRTATSSTGTGATAWFSDPADLDLTKDWLQIRLSFTAPSTIVAGQGLTQYIYDNASYQVLIEPYNYRFYGTIPNHSAGGNPNMSLTTSPHGARWVGKFIATETGTYSFRMAVDMTGKLWLNDTLVLNYTTAVNPGGSNTINLVAGTLYDCVVEWVDDQGGLQYCRLEVDSPSTANRTVVATDFYDDRFGTLNGISITNLKVVYTGTATSYFDIRFYNGPATPTLIAPPDGSSTEEFNPELTAKSENCDHIQFQLDNVKTFDSSELSTWEVLADINEEVTTTSPVADRPDGTWYWRARSKLGGVYGNWADYFTLTILPLVERFQFIYLNVNNGFEQTDSIVHNRYIYLNKNQGDIADNLYTLRHLYVDVNTGFGVGEVIYPIYDRTEVRKTTFTEDGDAFI